MKETGVKYHMAALVAIAVMLGIMLELLGIGSAVTLRIGRAVITMSLGGFLIAAGLGLIVI